jgi:hypothetical protein
VIDPLLAKTFPCGTLFFTRIVPGQEKEQRMSCKALGLGLVTALFVSGSALACPMHETVAKNQTPVDYSALKKVQVAEVPVDAWLIKYLDAWQNA